MTSVCFNETIFSSSPRVFLSPLGSAESRRTTTNDFTAATAATAAAAAAAAAASVPMTSSSLTRSKSVAVLRSRLKSIAGLSSALQKQYASVAPASAAAAAAAAATAATATAAAAASRRSSSFLMRPMHLERSESAFFARGATGSVLASSSRVERPSFSSFSPFKFENNSAENSDFILSKERSQSRINSMRSSKKENKKQINKTSDFNSHESLGLFDQIKGDTSAEGLLGGDNFQRNEEQPQEGTEESKKRELLSKTKKEEKEIKINPENNGAEEQPIFELINTWDSEKILACIRTLRPHGRAVFKEARKRLLREMQRKIYKQFEPLKNELDRRGVFDEQTNALRVKAKLRCRAFDAAQQLRRTFNELALKENYDLCSEALMKSPTASHFGRDAAKAVADELFELLRNPVFGETRPNPRIELFPSAHWLPAVHTPQTEFTDDAALKRICRLKKMREENQKEEINDAAQSIAAA